jgi:cytochrome c55X
MNRVLLLTSSFIVFISPALAAVDAMRQTELMYLLKQDCGSCHGMTLKGGLGPSLLPEALDGKPNELLVSTILEGRANTAMPPWKAMLTLEEAQWMVTQLQQGVN